MTNLGREKSLFVLFLMVGTNRVFEKLHMMYNVLDIMYIGCYIMNTTTYMPGVIIMSYSEKRAIVSILAGIAVLVSYCIYIYGKVKTGEAASDDLKFWAGAILIFIVVGIVASIVIEIAFHILLSISIAIREQMETGKTDDKRIEKEIAAEMVVDEMDKLVELKAMRVGFVVAGIGFVTALVYAYLGYSTAIMMNIIFISFSVGTILEGFSRLFFYRRGISRG